MAVIMQGSKVLTRPSGVSTSFTRHRSRPYCRRAWTWIHSGATPYRAASLFAWVACCECLQQHGRLCEKSISIPMFLKYCTRVDLRWLQQCSRCLVERLCNRRMVGEKDRGTCSHEHSEVSKALGSAVGSTAMVDDPRPGTTCFGIWVR